MAYRFRLWYEQDLSNPVIDMLIRSPNKDHAAFVTKDLHLNWLANSYIPFSGKSSRSSLVEVSAEDFYELGKETKEPT